MSLNYIISNIDPIIFKIGNFPLRWYGTLFALGFLIGIPAIQAIFQKENRSIEYTETLATYFMLGTILGARVGHMIFYQFNDFIRNPLQAFLPIAWDAEGKIIYGLRGLASHGAVIGVLLACGLAYLKINYDISWHYIPWKISIKKKARPHFSLLWSSDRMVIFIALGGALVRIGNFTNSGIIGTPTKSDYGILFARNIHDELLESANALDTVTFEKRNDVATNEKIPYQPITITLKFKKVSYEPMRIQSFLENNIKRRLVYGYSSQHIYEKEGEPLHYTLEKSQDGKYIAKIATWGIPRHPAQLYEAFAYFILFIILLLWWYIRREKIKPGTLVGAFFLYVFSFRFFIEYVKITKRSFNFLKLNNAQWLSIPFIILGIFLILYGLKDKHKEK